MKRKSKRGEEKNTKIHTLVGIYQKYEKILNYLIYSLHEGEVILKGFNTEIKKYQNTRSTKLPTMLKMKSMKKYFNT